MKKLSIEQFDFFLGGKTEVKSLEYGAKTYGGATEINGKIFSNTDGMDSIQVLDGLNTISLYVPSTVAVDANVDNSEDVEKYMYHIQAHYPESALTLQNAHGAWFSEDMDKTVIEEITIISLNLEDITPEDVENFRLIGLQVKQDMSQEAVSITFNDSLALV